MPFALSPLAVYHRATRASRPHLPAPPIQASESVKPTFRRNFRICLCPLPSALAVCHLVPHAVTPSPPPSQRPASASANRNFRFRICHLPITGIYMRERERGWRFHRVWKSRRHRLGFFHKLSATETDPIPSAPPSLAKSPSPQNKTNHRPPSTNTLKSQEDPILISITQ
ncbi:hypothetical protein TIFTF001_054162 [Ficus carica]|uniref:Uncharacterized protein n=1 Tax=Ficus carica TaxID=3494 RepID=A0AA88JFE0_FICCA|nr:hypothetical protein TIFTF001_054162 [Ficus carica]